MKKFFTLALASLMLLSCSKDSIWNAQEQGQLSVNVEQGASVFVETKAASTDNFYLKIVKNGVEVYYKKVSESKSPITLPTGTYTVSAENITAEEALAGRGKQRLADTKENVTVSANQTNTITLNCVMVNSQVSFAFDETFKSAFDMANTQITESSTRGIVWSKNATLESEIAYFEPGTLNYTITTKRAGEDKTYTGQVEMAAKTWHKLTVKASVVNGQLGITVTADDSVAEDLGNITVDPYK
jgi:uncharacterized protein YcfL